MTTQPFSGIVYGSNETGLVHLPLDEVSVQALVIDVSARVTLSQIFYNNANERTPRARYIFPVPAGAGVCAFEMHTEDGRMIRGVAKETQQAQLEHEQALNAGKLTALVEWATDDVFTISVGSIPPRQSVTTNLTYVMDLMSNDIASQIRLQLPMYIGERYGKLPNGMQGASQASSRTRVRVTAIIQTQGAAKAITSPTHPSLTVVPYETHHGRPSRHRMVAKLKSREFLNKDFVLVIEAERLDVPRCFAEHGPPGSGTVALQLTMVPKFEPSPLLSKEYIFLIDRSGSMGGGFRIENAKTTLVTLLHSLPKTGTYINVFSFGSSSTSFYPTSQMYNQVTLVHAEQHVDSMTANYRGTKIRAALEHVFRSRNRTLPTDVFVLTDGDSFDTEATFACIRRAMSQCTAVTPLHVFVLGIGDSASTAMCQGIANAGNGVYLMTTASEDILGKSSSLVRAGRTTFLKDVTVDWGLPSSVIADSTVRFVGDDAVIRQAPLTIESIYPGHRFAVFAIVKHDGFVLPREIVLHGKKGDQSISIRVPVQRTRLSDELPRIPTIHTLAAQRLVRSVVAGDVPQGPGFGEEQKKTSIIRLGERYQLATRYTSFVAVEDTESTTQRERPRPRDDSSSAEPSGTGSSGWLGYVTMAMDFATALTSSWLGTVFRSWVPTLGGNIVPREDAQEMDADGRSTDPEDEPSDNFSTMSSLLSYSDSEWSDAPVRRPLTPLLQENPRSPSPQVDRDQTNSAANDSSSHRPHQSPLQEDVLNLIRLQSFDGSFALGDSISRIVGAAGIAQIPAPQIDERVWATALAVAYLRKHLSQQPELLEGLIEKAMEFAHDSGITDFEVLVERARGIVT